MGIFYPILKKCAVSRRFFVGLRLHANRGIRMESSRTRWRVLDLWLLAVLIYGIFFTTVTRVLLYLILISESLEAIKQSLA